MFYSVFHLIWLLSLSAKQGDDLKFDTIFQTLLDLVPGPMIRSGGKSQGIFFLEHSQISDKRNERKNQEENQSKKALQHARAKNQ